jgi:hypothetical protein
MKRLLQIARKCRAAATSVGLWLAWTAAVWAQGSAPAGSGSSPSPFQDGGAYVLPYAMVVLCVLLGVFLVVHTSKRRDRPKN